MINHSEEDIKDSEIKQAFELLEKKRLKKLFNDIENNQINHVSKKITPIFTWMKFAVAASVFGLIITTGVLYLKNGEEAEFANINKDINKENEILSALLNERKIKSDSVNSAIIKESSYGFAKKEQNINIITYVLKERIDTLTVVAKKIDNQLLKRKFYEQIDSLNILNNTYLFNENNLFLYLNNKTKIEVLKLNEIFYIKIENKYYEIETNKKNKLIQTDNKYILEKLNKIYFINHQ
jgi:DNA-binding LytR/AlgR family response regulator